jgi:hypothetical protein
MGCKLENRLALQCHPGSHKVPEFRVPSRPMPVYRGSHLRKVPKRNVAARLVVPTSGLRLSFFLLQAGAAGISIPLQLTQAPRMTIRRLSRNGLRERAEPQGLDAR